MSEQEKLDNLIKDLPEEKQEEVKNAFAEMKERQVKGVSDEAFLKASESIAKTLSANFKEDAEKDEKAEKAREALHSFSLGRDADAAIDIDSMVRQKNAKSKDDRVRDYLKATREEDYGYIKQVDTRIATFFKAMKEKDMLVVRALSEGTDADGGYLVPDEFRATVVMKRDTFAPIREDCTVWPMTTKLLEVPAEAARPAMRWGSEDATLTTGSAEFSNVQLQPEKLYGRIPLTHELFNDAAIAITNYLRDAYARGLAKKEIEAFLTGDGSGKPKGLTQYTLGSTISAGSNKADSLLNLFYALPEAYAEFGKWYMSRRTLRNIRKQKDSNNQYLNLYDAERKEIEGRPVREASALGDGVVLFGDFKFYFIGDREEMSVEMTTEGGTAWERDRIEMKVRERVDGQCALTDAFVKGTGF